MTEHGKNKLRLWNAFADIDPAYTKPIKGKPYRGTSPNPQYVIRCLTEMFGPVGEGFGWEVMAEGFQNLGDEVLHWCRISFWHSSNPDRRFEAYGQTKALMKTSSGMMSDEDAPKKSMTDAIVKAASQIGIASNIFLGRWDDQKYVTSVADAFAQKDEREAVEAAKALLRGSETIADLVENFKSLSGYVRANESVIEVGAQVRRRIEGEKASTEGE